MVWYTIFIIILIICVILALLYYIWRFRQQTVQYRLKFPSAIYCLDGDKVRTLSECIIDDCLTRHGIQHNYEGFINKAQRDFKYDWFLPNVKIYLEFFGYHGKKYMQTRHEKEKFYRANRKELIVIEPSDLDHIDVKLQLKFGKNIWEKIAKGKHCPNCGSQLDNRMN